MNGNDISDYVPGGRFTYHSTLNELITSRFRGRKWNYTNPGRRPRVLHSKIEDWIFKHGTTQAGFELEAIGSNKELKLSRIRNNNFYKEIRVYLDASGQMGMVLLTLLK